MRREAYAAARTIAPKLHAYFARHRSEAADRGQTSLALLPDAETIEAIIDTAFWASLRREEGYSPRISLALLSPDEAQHPLLLERPLPLGPDALTRVAPAMDRPGVHLGISRSDGELAVWGTTRSIPLLCFVVEIAAPGLLVVKHHSGDKWRKFVNVAVLEGDLIKVVDEHASEAMPDCPKLLKSLLGFESAVSWIQSVNPLVQLAVSMRADGRGGSLLVVPAGTDAWRESIVQPIPYAVSPAFVELAHLSRDAQASHEELGPAIAAVAGLTAVDGAVLLTDTYELLGFGAKIGRRKGWPRVEQVRLSEPIEGAARAIVLPEQLGGTRHLSAAQFVHDQRDAVALVASQDGRFTVFEWSPCDEMVHAHRLDVLLL
jgi:hypothetical protein